MVFNSFSCSKYASKLKQVFDVSGAGDTIIASIAAGIMAKINLDSKFLRPTEVDFLRGDFSKARKKLKWKPLISTNELIDDMIQDEMNR